MAFSITWSVIAYEDLREIVRYIALDNPVSASKLADRIIYNLELASEHPYMNRPVPEKADDSIREIILKPYQVIYQVDESNKALHVLRIWHGYRGTPCIE